MSLLRLRSNIQKDNKNYIVTQVQNHDLQLHWLDFRLSWKNNSWKILQAIKNSSTALLEISRLFDTFGQVQTSEQPSSIPSFWWNQDFLQNKFYNMDNWWARCQQKSLVLICTFQLVNDGSICKVNLSMACLGVIQTSLNSL